MAPDGDVQLSEQQIKGFKVSSIHVHVLNHELNTLWFSFGNTLENVGQPTKFLDQYR
jgi:hypothetical protein